MTYRLCESTSSGYKNLVTGLGNKQQQCLALRTKHLNLLLLLQMIHYNLLKCLVHVTSLKNAIFCIFFLCCYAKIIRSSPRRLKLCKASLTRSERLIKKQISFQIFTRFLFRDISPEGQQSRTVLPKFVLVPLVSLVSSSSGHCLSRIPPVLIQHSYHENENYSADKSKKNKISTRSISPGPKI